MRLKILTFVAMTELLCAPLIAQDDQGAQCRRELSASEVAGTKDDRFRARLADGAVIEFVGVCEYPSAGCGWWRADGSALPEPQVERGKYSQLKRPRSDEVTAREPQDCLREFIVRATTSDRKSTLKARCLEAHNQGQGPSEGVIDGKLQINHHFAAAIAAVPKGGCHYFERPDGSMARRGSDTLAVDIDVEFSSGPWETVATCGKSGDCTGVFEGADLEFGFAAEVDGRAAISVAHTYLKNDLDMRLVAIDQDGKERTMSEGSDSRPTSHTPLHLIKAVFRLPLAKVKEFRFQTRPLHRIEFRNVAITPQARRLSAYYWVESLFSPQFRIYLDGKLYASPNSRKAGTAPT